MTSQPSRRGAPVPPDPLPIPVVDNHTHLDISRDGEEVSVDDLAYTIETAGGLRLGGVMGVAPLGGDPVAAYARLAEASHALVAAYPEATVISAGMSGDLEEAVKAGATHVRVGSAVLGERRRNE